jgi:hypothetical protein
VDLATISFHDPRWLQTFPLNSTTGTVVTLLFFSYITSLYPVGSFSCVRLSSHISSDGLFFALVRTGRLLRSFLQQRDTADAGLSGTSSVREAQVPDLFVRSAA